MKTLIISHVTRGGAFRVAEHYAKTLNSDLLASPSALKIIVKILLLQPSVLIFNAPHQCARVALLLRLLAPNVKIFCVEHFILPQIIRSEFKNRFKRDVWLFNFKILQFLKIKIICIDLYSAKARRRLLGIPADLIIGNSVRETNNTLKRKPYDWIWAAGLSDQKRWRETKEILAKLTANRPNIKILVCSYEKPSKEDLNFLNIHNIDFSLNDADWSKKGARFFFTSNYEGFPLALAEAMESGMGILAWCRSSCVSQLLKHYDGYKWVSNHSTPCITDFDNTPVEGKQKPNSLLIHRDNYIKNAIQGLVNHE